MNNKYNGVFFKKGVVGILTMLMLCVGTLSLSLKANAQNYACSCTGSACGSNAIGGDQGDIFTDITSEQVATRFQTNANTGWTCVIPAKIRGNGGPKSCYCKGYCGNNGIGADPNYFDIGLSQSKIDSSYGGGKPGNHTGWLCGNYRGKWSAITDSGASITASELTQKGYSFPTDLAVGATDVQFANYAWRLFIAATQQSSATKTSGAGRAVADSVNNFISTGKKTTKSNPLVFESFYHRTEAFPFYNASKVGSKPSSPINQAPVYHTYYEGGSDGETKVPVVLANQNYVYLDETNQISQNFLYYQNSKSPDFPVLFMAKVNQAETEYALDSARKPPSANDSWDFPNNVVEVKSAWRRVADIKNSDTNLYHQAQATYYQVNSAGIPQVKTDTFALLAIHIIQKTANYQEFIFTTFEHVNSVTRDSKNQITDPAYKTEYNHLSYQTPSSDPHTATASGAYDINEIGQPSKNNKLTTYTLPNAGAISQNFTTVVQPNTIVKGVNDVNNQVNALIKTLDPNNIWANYRLKGVQAVPTSDSSVSNYYLANIVVESSQPGIQLFSGILLNGGVSKHGETAATKDTFYVVNCRGDIGDTQCVYPNESGISDLSPITYNNVSIGVEQSKPVPTAQHNMGGCQGCHGAAQQLGRDFSFLPNGVGGKGKALDSVAAQNISQELKDEHNRIMIKSSGFDL